MTKAIIFDVKNFEDDEELLSCLRKLREKYLLVYFSNADEIDGQTKKDLGYFDLFHIVLLSSDFGVQKPEKEFYDILVDFLKDEEVTPENCLFVDDNKANLAPAENLGMKVILYKDPKQLIAEI